MQTTKLTALSAANSSYDDISATSRVANLSQHDINREPSHDTSGAFQSNTGIVTDAVSVNGTSGADGSQCSEAKIKTQSTLALAKSNNSCHLAPFFKARATVISTPSTEQTQLLPLPQDLFLPKQNQVFQFSQQPELLSQEHCRFSSLSPDADFTSSWVSTLGATPATPVRAQHEPLPHFLAPRLNLSTPAATWSPFSTPTFVTPSFIAKDRYPSFPSVGGADTLGRHWKQMGCQTRQYLQPTIPLPASTRLAAATKHLRGGGASLGGPPGSLSPMTPSKSWAQIVASSGAKSTQHLQPQQASPKRAEFNVDSASVSKAGAVSALVSSGGTKVRSLSFSIGSFGKTTPLLPPLHTSRVHGGTSNNKTAVRGLAGLGAATSSNAQFKSLLLRLKTALEKEESWKPKDFDAQAKPSDVILEDEEQCALDGRRRDECIYWSAWIVRKCRFGSETAALTVTLFDAFCENTHLAPVDSKLTVMLCILLAAKFCEEDSDIPTLKDLLKLAEVEVPLGDAVRIERLILGTLNWDLNRITPLKFLEILHALLLCHQPQLLEDIALGLTPAKHLERLTWKMQRLTASHRILLFRPAVIAVALLSVDLETMDTPDWRLVTVTLEKIVRIEAGQLLQCRNAVARTLGTDRGNKGMTPEKSKRMTTNGNGVKLKRKHVPSESGSIEAAETQAGANEGRVMLKRQFNAESPCKTEAREEEEGDRFAALRGLAINIY